MTLCINVSLYVAIVTLFLITVTLYVTIVTLNFAM